MSEQEQPSGWGRVGKWLQGNAGTGAALVGSLLTGNLPGAVAAGIALASSASGTNDPDKALLQFQQDPTTVIRLRELALQDSENIRAHIRQMEELRMADAQAEHSTTAEVIKSGDNAEDIVVRRTRPLQSWLSLVMAFLYVGYQTMQRPQLEVSVYVLSTLLVLPWAYAGLRQVGKGMDSLVEIKKLK